jgi:hypothetical protein
VNKFLKHWDRKTLELAFSRTDDNFQELYERTEHTPDWVNKFFRFWHFFWGGE